MRRLTKCGVTDHATMLVSIVSMMAYYVCRLEGSSETTCDAEVIRKQTDLRSLDGSKDNRRVLSTAMSSGPLRRRERRHVPPLAYTNQLPSSDVGKCVRLSTARLGSGRRSQPRCRPQRGWMPSRCSMTYRLPFALCCVTIDLPLDHEMVDETSAIIRMLY